MPENGNPTRKDAGLPSSVVEFVITWDQITGAIQLKGPVNNKVLCYGILESAKDAVRSFVEANQARIVPGIAMPKGPA